MVVVAEEGVGGVGVILVEASLLLVKETPLGLGASGCALAFLAGTARGAGSVADWSFLFAMLKDG